MPYAKIHLKQVIGLNVKAKGHKVWTIKEKLLNWTLSSLNTFLSTLYTVEKIKKQAIEWEKMFMCVWQRTCIWNI